jgi:hypothetical protein
MADHHEEEQLGKLYDARAARRLIRYLGPYKRTVGVALVSTITSSRRLKARSASTGRFME